MRNACVPVFLAEREQLQLDLRVVIAMAQKRQLNDLKKDRHQKYSAPRVKLTGAEQCIVGEMSAFSKGVSLECMYYFKHIDPSEITELARRAAPHLQWEQQCGLLLGCGLDNAKQSIVMVGGGVRFSTTERFTVTITEPWARPE
jgi:hypothetical protein